MSRPCSSHEININNVSSAEHRLSISEEINTPRFTLKNQRKRKRSAKEDSDQTDIVLAMIQERLRANDNDDSAVFAKNVGRKLKALPRETRLYTEKLINDLLFEAEMGNVSKYTRIVSLAADSNNFLRDGPVLASNPNHHSYD